MKKLICLSIAVITLIGMLTGCTSPTDDTGTTGHTEKPSTITTNPTTDPTTKPTSEPTTTPTTDSSTDASKETTKS